MNYKLVLPALLLSAVLQCGCGNSSHERAPQVSAKESAKEREDEINRKKNEELRHDYSKIPDDHILDNGPGTALYAELTKRYKTEAGELKKQVEATGAKLYFVILTVETGKDMLNGNKYGIPVIRNILSELNIDYTDFTPLVAAQNHKEISQIPKDAHWSKKGAIFLADHLAVIIRKYSNITSKVTYKDEERPETLGDLTPNDDEIMDGAKDMPYHVRANSQGIRMDHDVKFPKKKKHILLMGDSAFFCPFLNNEYTITAVLQKMFPDDEIMNTSIIGYTIDDYLTLWNEKAKYAEPDLVIVQTNGGDITDLFFTSRNVVSRTHKPYYPTPNEEKYYKENYGAK